VWSPDGNLLAATGDEGVVVMDLTGAVQTTVDRATGGLAWQGLSDQP
jgi:hypothetical protein